MGQESTWAAEASECANEQGKFWEYHNYLYNNRGAENSGAFSKVNLERFAATLELNTSAFNSCLEGEKYAKITDDTQAGQAVCVSGTPTVFINGVAIVGAQAYTTFKAAIDSELSKAK